MLEEMVLLEISRSLEDDAKVELLMGSSIEAEAEALDSTAELKVTETGASVLEGNRLAVLDSNTAVLELGREDSEIELEAVDDSTSELVVLDPKDPKDETENSVLEGLDDSMLNWINEASVLVESG